MTSAVFWITQYQGFLESLLAMKNYRLAKPLSYPLSAAAFPVRKWVVADSDMVST